MAGTLILAKRKGKRKEEQGAGKGHVKKDCRMGSPFCVSMNQSWRPAYAARAASFKYGLVSRLIRGRYG